MLSNVPFRDRYPIVQQFLYQGKTFAGIVTSQEVLDKIPGFEIREDDIFLTSYPRTGTRWTAEILSWIHYEADEEKIKSVSNLDRCPYLEFSVQRNSMENIAALPSTKARLFASHLSFNMAPRQLTKKGKIICILRNPKDTAVSLYHFYRINKGLGPYEGTWQDFLQGFIQGDSMYGSYFDHFVKSWWERRDQKNILFVRYEEMKREPAAHVKKIAEFLGKSFSEEMVDLIVDKTSFKTMKNDPNANASRDPAKEKMFRQDVGAEFIRKGEVSDWKNYFTVAQNEEFDNVIEEKFQGTGLVFEY